MAATRTARFFRWKALVSVLVISLIIGALGVFVTSSIVNIRAYNRLRVRVDRVLMEAERARLSEKDFLLNATVTASFILTGEDDAILENRKHTNTVLKELQALKQGRLVRRLALAPDFDSMYLYMEMYARSFQVIVGRYQAKGFKDYGLEGEMRDAIHYIEDEAQLPIRQDYLLMLRRHEKDFLLRKDLEYRRKFMYGLDVFKAHIREVGAQQGLGPGDPEVQKLCDTLEAYAQNFNRLVELEKMIGLNEGQGLRREMTAAAELLDRRAYATMAALDARADMVADRLMTAIVGLFGLTLVVLVFRTWKGVEQAQTIRDTNKQLQRKNENIMSSIHYGRRIQEGLLPSLSYISDVFGETFVFYRPRDVVSGDFYWFAHKDDEVIVAAIDCTGHGVPGAFMTMLASALMNQVVLEMEMSDPGQILKEVDARLEQTVRKYGDDETSRTEGMDMSLVAINMVTHTLRFAGAKLPLYFFNEGKFNEIKGSRYSIGGHPIQGAKTFESHTMRYKDGDAIYLFTDGFQDQFGGESGRKFLRKHFRKMLQDIVGVEMEYQPTILEHKLAKWQGSERQTDDILVIGIRF